MECNPLIGPQLFDAVEAIMAGKTLPKRVQTEEGVFEHAQAAANYPTGNTIPVPTARSKDAWLGFICTGLRTFVLADASSFVRRVGHRRTLHEN